MNEAGSLQGRKRMTWPGRFCRTLPQPACHSPHPARTPPDSETKSRENESDATEEE